MPVVEFADLGVKMGRGYIYGRGVLIGLVQQNFRIVQRLSLSSITYVNSLSSTGTVIRLKNSCVLLP